MTPGSGASPLSALGSPTLESVTGTVEALVAVLLIVLLAEREVLRAYAGTRRTPRYDVLTIAIVPLLIAVVVVLLLRMTGQR